MIRAFRLPARASGLLLVFAIVAAACGPAATPVPTAQPTEVPPAELTGSLTVLDWAGYDAPDFWVDFQNTYPKATVNFEIGASDADIYAKMKAGDQADIFHPYTGWLQFYVDEGLVEEIDTSKLTYWDKVPDSFKKIGQINGKQYFLPWDWGFTSILYRTDKVPEGIDSWAALMDPKFKGHVSMWDDGPGAVTISSYIHGWDETKITPEQLASEQEEWIKQRDVNLFYGPASRSGGCAWQWRRMGGYAWQRYAFPCWAGVPVAYADPRKAATRGSASTAFAKAARTTIWR
jgi:spermidine/putrescine-binding protein